jgi:hypothetical protein
MPSKKQSQQLDTVDAVNALPPTNHNEQFSDDALISENFKLEDLIKQATAKFDEWARPHKARIGEIEGEIHRRLIERKADSTKTDSGTAYFSHLMNTKIEDGGATFDWAADHWAEVGADVKISVKIDTVRTHMENHNGHPPPGMTVSYYTRLNIKRS